MWQAVGIFVAMPQLSTQVDSDQMGQGLGGLLIEAAEDYSQRCLTAGSHPKPSVSANPMSPRMSILSCVSLAMPSSCLAIIIGAYCTYTA